MENSINTAEKLFLSESWFDLCEKINISKNKSKQIYKVLNFLYSDPRRSYHNLKHIHDCLVKFDNYKFSLIHYAGTDFDLIKLAIWFHDSFYTFSPGHDESMSQKLLESLIPKKTNISLSNVSRLIDLTNNHNSQSVKTNDEILFLDIDLSILGSERSEYIKYRKNIFKEYINFHPLINSVPGSKFTLLKVRNSFIESMLKRDKIFNNKYFKKYEDNARDNLLWELSENLKELEEIK